VLEAGTKNGDRVKTALLCPPTIYGTPSSLLELVNVMMLRVRQAPDEAPSTKNRNKSTP